MTISYMCILLQDLIFKRFLLIRTNHCIRLKDEMWAAAKKKKKKKKKRSHNLMSISYKMQGLFCHKGMV